MVEFAQSCESQPGFLAIDSPIIYVEGESLLPHTSSEGCIGAPSLFLSYPLFNLPNHHRQQLGHWDGVVRDCTSMVLEQIYPG